MCAGTHKQRHTQRDRDKDGEREEGKKGDRKCSQTSCVMSITGTTEISDTDLQRGNDMTKAECM